MLWLYILLGILLFFVILFLLPLSIRIGYGEELSLRAGLPGIYIPLLPKKKKKPVNLRRFTAKKYRRMRHRDWEARQEKKRKAEEKKRTKKAAAQKKKASKGKRLPPEPPSDEPSVISVILPLVGRVLDTFAGRLRIKVIRLHITVGGSDAAQIGLLYGAISQGAAYLLEILRQKTRFTPKKQADVEIRADFLLDHIQADCDIIFRLRLWDLLATGIDFLIRFIQEKARRTPPKHTSDTPNTQGKEEKDERKQTE